MKQKNLGRWYSLSDLFDTNSLLGFEEVNQKFSAGIEVSASLSVIRNASFKESKDKYFYPSLSPGRAMGFTHIHYEHTIIPIYNKLTLTITDELYSSNNYRLGLYFGDTNLTSQPRIKTDKDKLFEFSNWSNGLETKPVVIPNKTKYIKDIKLMIDYVL